MDDFEGGGFAIFLSRHSVRKQQQFAEIAMVSARKHPLSPDGQ
jgi:hypothetical protein